MSTTPDPMTPPQPPDAEMALRRAKELCEKYTFAKPVCVDETPDAQTVWIKIGVQSFCIDGYSDTKEEAAWMRLMIGKALDTLLTMELPAADSPMATGGA